MRTSPEYCTVGRSPLYKRKRFKQSKEMQRELPGMPAPQDSPPRKGSHAWKLAEWRRFRALAATHGGLTTPLFAQLLLGVSKQRVFQLIDAGLLETVEVLGKRFLLCDRLEEFSQLDRDSSTRYVAA